MKLRRTCVAAVILALLLAMMAGCTRGQTGKPAVAPGGDSSAAVVPFLLKQFLSGLDGADTLTAVFWIGRWETGPGKVSFDPKPLCTVQITGTPGSSESNCRSLVAWSGGRRVVFNAACVDAAFEVRETHPDYDVESLSPAVTLSFATLLAPAEGEPVAALGYGGAGLRLELRQGETRTVRDLVPPFPLTVPLGLFATGDRMLGVLGSLVVLEGGGEEYRVGLFELDRRNPSGEPSWHEVAVEPGVSPDISQPGAVMLKGRVYLPAWGRVAVVDPATHQLSGFVPVDEATRAWQATAEPIDACFPCRLGVWGDVLLVNYLGLVNGTRTRAVWALRDDGTVLGRMDVTPEGVRCLAGAAACGPAVHAAPGADSQLFPLPAVIDWPTVFLPGACQM